MNELQLFNFGDIPVRIQMENEEPIFCAMDICKILGYNNGAQTVEDNCNKKGISKRYTLTKGGNQLLTYISEGNLYRLIIKSNKPEAEKFEKWVCDEVLPTIRKKGVYMTNSTLERSIMDPDYIIGLLTELKKERAEKVQIQIESQGIQKELAEATPKALFADAVAASDDSILVRVLASQLRQKGKLIGQQRLFKYFRDNGYLCNRNGSWNMPTQKSMELGLFEIKTTTVVNDKNHSRAVETPKVTRKGQIYFINKLINNM